MTLNRHNEYIRRKIGQGHHTETRIISGNLRPVIVDKRGRILSVLPTTFLEEKAKEMV